VLRALAQPMIGHLDPAFLRRLDRVQAQLRGLFRAETALCFPLSATGSAGMEACLVNLLEPGERALVAVQGVFGDRMCQVVERAGAKALRVEAAMGEIVPPARMIERIRAEAPELVAMVHAETSTGVAQPVAEVARAAREAGALVVLDCVTSLSGMDVRFDDWAIDAAYSGTQKCLSAPPGLSPVAFGERALSRLRSRTRPVQSWYLDVGLIGAYLGEGRVYHHTAPVSMVFALGAALDRIFEEGLEARFARHLEAHRRLRGGLLARGFRFVVDAEHRLPMLNAVVPPYPDEAAVRRRLLEEFGIEVGGGLGALRGRIWRVGLMGENARAECVDRLLEALDRI
jgi:alanine-glyoxylate transaminase/serine-glyoxylate transaminase/serine-pyruvate transaminase